MKIKARSTVFTALFATMGIIGFISTAAADDDSDSDERGNKGRLLAQAEIEDLMSCYAYGADLIGRATGATPIFSPPFTYEDNLVDPDFAAGVEFWRNCMTEDWELALETEGEPSPLPPGLLAPGPLPFANIVNFFARSAQQRNTQHLFGSISSTVRGKDGTLTAYAIIHTMFLPESPTACQINVGTTTYTSEVVHRDGKWLLKKTTLNNTGSASTNEIADSCP